MHHVMKHRIQESPDDNGKTSANITTNLKEHASGCHEACSIWSLWFFFLADKFNLREAIKFKNWNFSKIAKIKKFWIINSELWKPRIFKMFWISIKKGVQKDIKTINSPKIFKMFWNWSKGFSKRSKNQKVLNYPGWGVYPHSGKNPTSFCCVSSSKK